MEKCCNRGNVIFMPTVGREGETSVGELTVVKIMCSFNYW